MNTIIYQTRKILLYVLILCASIFMHSSFAAQLQIQKKGDSVASGVMISKQKHKEYKKLEKRYQGCLSVIEEQKAEMERKDMIIREQKIKMRKQDVELNRRGANIEQLREDLTKVAKNVEKLLLALESSDNRIASLERERDIQKNLIKDSNEKIKKLEAQCQEQQKEGKSSSEKAEVSSEKTDQLGGFWGGVATTVTVASTGAAAVGYFFLKK